MGGEMANGDEKRQKDGWDKLAIFSGFLASVAVPVVIAVVGNWYTTAIKQQEVEISNRDQDIRQKAFDREWVQVGLSILRDADTGPNVRAWGVKIISEYAKVPMEEDTKRALVEKGAVLPEAAVLQQAFSPMQQSAPTVGIPTLSRPEAVAGSTTSRLRAVGELQTEGLQALLAKDLQAAISAYDQAYQLWPTFRNVDEIRRTLLQSARAPNEPDWKQLYGRIAKMDLRGVSDDVQNQLSAAAGGS
jgi:hypothetical protein